MSHRKDLKFSKLYWCATTIFDLRSLLIVRIGLFVPVAVTRRVVAVLLVLVSVANPGSLLVEHPAELRREAPLEPRGRQSAEGSVFLLVGRLSLSIGPVGARARRRLGRCQLFPSQLPPAHHPKIRLDWR